MKTTMTATTIMTTAGETGAEPLCGGSYTIALMDLMTSVLGQKRARLASGKEGKAAFLEGTFALPIGLREDP